MLAAAAGRGKVRVDGVGLQFAQGDVQFAAISKLGAMVVEPTRSPCTDPGTCAASTST
jgi:hypothetical protein